MSASFKNSEQNKRIKELIGFLKENNQIRNQQQFVEMVQSDRTTISKIVNGKQDVPSNMFDRIINAFPSVSRDWLVNGDGEMLKEEGDSAHVENSGINLMQMVRMQQENIARLIEQMECVTKTNMTISRTNEELVKTNNMLVQMISKRGLAEDANGAAGMAAVAAQG